MTKKNALTGKNNISADDYIPEKTGDIGFVL